MGIEIKDLENVILLTDLIARIGIPMVQSIITAIEEKSPTISDIHKLRLSIKDPEDYFTDPNLIKEK